MKKPPGGRQKEDDRYLWPEMLRVIQELQPAWVVGENVAGIVSMALDQVLSDLEAQGYETRAFVLPAAGVDAPHRRYRVAIVAHADGIRQQRDRADRKQERGVRPEEKEFEGQGEVLAYSESRKSRGLQQSGIQADFGTGGQTRDVDDPLRVGRRRNDRREQLPQPSDGCWWPAEPDVGRVAHGVPRRVDRLRCLGNAVVPQQFYPIFQAIRTVEEVGT